MSHKTRNDSEVLTETVEKTVQNSANVDKKGKKVAPLTKTDRLAFS